MANGRTNFIKVKEFMKVFGQEVKSDAFPPEWPDKDTRQLRLDLIGEEFQELVESVDDQDMVGVADALTDLLYVVYGAGHAFGIPLDRCFTEVHESNMSKLDENGKPIYRKDGKVLKGKNFREPNLKKILYPQGEK